MNLYRALYQKRDGTLAGITFAAASARAASHIAAALTTQGRILLTVRLLRPLQSQLTLEAT